MAYDEGRGRIVLFGGLDQGFLADTWEYDGANWTRITTAQTPPARYEPALVYDRARARTVLFGGYGNQGHLGDVWEYDGAGWTQRNAGAGPSRRAAHMAAYDSSRRTVVLFGGEDSTSTMVSDTWTYGPVQQAQWLTFGSGCAGSLGAPALQPAGGALPWLGGPFTLEVLPVPAGTVVLPFLGLSRTTAAGQPLPRDLGAFGLPGCVLRVAPDAVFVAIANGTAARYPLALPPAPALLGTIYWAQALVVDPAANLAGATLTNGGELQLGGR
jgi:hypothetical protein